MSILKTPINIKALTLPNRVVMPPMATEKSNEDGSVSDAICAYYDKKSKGAYLGLIIAEHSFVSPDGRASMAQLSMADDSVIPGMKRLTDIVHANGGRIFSQINHAGSATNAEISGFEPVSASAVLHPRKGVSVPREMTQDDIDALVSAFASAAARVKASGFDGVEIHSAHGYLLDQFYSPLTNKRTDAYCGSSIEGRIKLHLEIIAAVRAAVGDDFPVALRLGASDYRDGGATVEDSVIAAREFEKAGIDMLDISGGFCGFTNPNCSVPGYFSELTEAIKQAVNIPVMLTGGITDVGTAEQLLSDNKADLIGIGRTILYNSSWARENLG